ncbi:hypothetical protein BDP27DRAFT_1388376 [Rhodocollybia butyracea]|uniref:RRM domain-containing protein n=1 Tax=Rhodocollybia butyracea TaxID=206335 RepID=A0A9P5QCV6_9AGAR|nr:hypothetical protein BDP27DRAFT_1388376 [Rhodocollybia butyracea]
MTSTTWLYMKASTYAPPTGKQPVVGNVPYNMGEEQLIDVFKSVGQVVGFRLVFDRDTGKPKGYGFCEFADHETASSAVRNLNNYEVGGRPLRIDLADSDPFLEGKTTVRGELLDGGGGGPPDRWRPDSINKSQDFLSSLPPGVPVAPGSTVLDTISQTLATINPTQLMDVLAHMKAFVITHPEQARILLVSHPQFAYALFQALLLNKIVDQSILQRMLAATVGSGTLAPPALPTNGPPPQFYPPNNYPTSSHLPPFPPNMALPPPMFAPTPGAMPPATFYRPTPPPGMPTPSQTQLHPGGSSTPVLQQPSPIQANFQPLPSQANALSNISESHRVLLRQVVSMSDEQVNALPETERAAILQLRTQFAGAIAV